MTDETMAAPGTRTIAPARPRLTLRFTARDLLNLAIFAVIYFVVVYAIAMLGIISPLVMLLTLPLSIIVGGIPYMLFLTRVRHAGMITVFGIALSVLYLISGHPWISTVLTIVLCLIAEVILWAGAYRSRWAAIWAYTVFSAWFIGPMLPLLMNREEYLHSPGMEVMGPEYIAAFDQTVTVTALWIYNIATLVCGLIGGLFGSAILRKHFRKAGLA